MEIVKVKLYYANDPSLVNPPSQTPVQNEAAFLGYKLQQIAAKPQRPLEKYV